MSTKTILLLPSTSMDKEQFKHDENNLIRLSERHRELLNINERIIKIENSSKTASIKLSQFRAFKEDIQTIKNLSISLDNITCIGFVTTYNFNKLFNDSKKNIVTVVEEDEILTKNITSLIGADPEFLIYDKVSSEIKSASSLITKAGDLGSDGAMGEVRPSPSTTPEGLVKNIQSIFNDSRYNELMSTYTCKATCYAKNAFRDFPVGGHIHVGNIEAMDHVSTDLKLRIFAIINKILDEFLGIPLIKIDLGYQGKGRRNSNISPGGAGYGNFGQYRLAPKNGATKDKRLEYRTLSGMWLMHPLVATAVLGTAKLIIDEIWFRLINTNFEQQLIFPDTVDYTKIYSNSFSAWEMIPICKEFNAIKPSQVMSAILREANPEKIDKQFLNLWHENLKSFNLYSAYELYVKLLKDILLVPTNELDEADKTIQSNWIENKKFLI